MSINDIIWQPTLKSVEKMHQKMEILTFTIENEKQDSFRALKP